MYYIYTYPTSETKKIKEKLLRSSEDIFGFPLQSIEKSIKHKSYQELFSNYQIILIFFLTTMRFLIVHLLIEIQIMLN